MSENHASTPTPAQMIVWASDATDASELKRALSERYRLNVIQDLEALNAARPVEEAPVLLLHLAPVLTLARAMANDLPPQAALRAWREETRTLLALNRGDRRRTRLLDISEALDYPAEFRSHFNLPAGPGPEAPLRNRQDDPFLLTLAQRLLLGEGENRALAAELEAVSINLTGAAPADPVDPDMVYRDYRELREAEAETGELRRRGAELEAEKAELEARIDLLDAQAKAAREEIEARTRQSEAEKAGLEARIDLLDAQAKAAQEEIESLARREKALGEDAAALPGLRRRLSEREQSLQATDTLLRKLRAEQEVLTEELTRSRAQAADLETDLQRICNSRSYRLTGPLRRLRAALSGRRPS